MGCSASTLPQACSLRSRCTADSVPRPPSPWRSGGGPAVPLAVLPCQARDPASLLTVASWQAARARAVHATEPVRELEYPTPDATHTLLASCTASAGKRDGPTITAIIGEPTAATTQAIGDAPAGYVSSSPCAAPATERRPDRPAALSHPSCDLAATTGHTGVDGCSQ